MKRARFTLALAFASMLAMEFSVAQDFQEEGKDGPYQPTPVSERPRPEEEALLQKPMQDDEWVELERAGYDSAARERDTLEALGFSPDDPLARQALRAEVAAGRPAQTLAAGDFFLDTDWGSGGYTPYRYYGPAEGVYRGIRAVTLADGTIVALGSVRLPGGALQAGLTRSNAAGQRIKWSLASPDFLNNQYNMFVPGTWANAPAIYQVVDLKAKGDRFYVLATVDLRPPTYPNVYGVGVYCFEKSGAYCGHRFAWGNNNRIANHAVALDIEGNRLAVLGRNSTSTSGGFWTVKWDLAADGGMQNATFGQFPAPNGYDRSEPVDIAFRRSGVFVGDGSYYVLFTRKWSADVSSNDFDPCLFAVTSSHAPDTSFPGSTAGVRCKYFDVVTGGRDKAVALVNKGYATFFPILRDHEDMHVLVNVQRSGADGFGVWALRDRADDTTFGASGKQVYADTCSSPFCLSPATYRPASLAYLGSDLAVVGDLTRRVLTTFYTDPMFARISRTDGSVQQNTVLDSGYGDGQFNGLVVRDSQHVVAIGEAIDPTVAATAARTQIMIGLTSDDTIFKNGFD